MSGTKLNTAPDSNGGKNSGNLKKDLFSDIEIESKKVQKLITPNPDIGITEDNTDPAQPPKFEEYSDETDSINQEVSEPVQVMHKLKFTSGDLLAIPTTYVLPKKTKFSKFFKKVNDVKPITWITLSIVSVLFIVGSFLFFNNHAMPNTKLGNQNISFWSRQKISNFAEAQVINYNISVKKTGNIEKVDLNQLGIKIIPNTSVNNVFEEQNKTYLQKLLFWKKRNYKFTNSIDIEKVNSFIENYKSTVNVLGQNATITIENGEVVIIPEINNDQISFKDPISRINYSLDTANPLVLEQEQVITPPEITTAKLEPLREYIKSMIQTDLSLTLNGNSIPTTKEQKASWLTIDSTSTDKAGVKFDNIKIEAFIDGAIQPFVKPPRSRVLVTNSDGTQKELVAGEDGINVTDKAKVASNIISALESKQKTVIDVPVAYSQRSTITAADHPKWIQVDLTNKRLYAYEHGELVKELLISAGAPATPTVVGEYAIKYKIKKQTMRGLNADGSRYVQPDVEWVNYFYADYAIHGNYWRPAEVFGNTNTSHGCVGIQNDGAEWVYNWAPVGTPIITHY